MDGISMVGLTGELRKDEPMSRHTSWRTGGVASWYYTPDGVSDLGEFLSRVPQGHRGCLVWSGKQHACSGWGL